MLDRLAACAFCVRQRSEEKPMQHLLIVGSLILFAIPTASNAQSSLDGTWKVDFHAAMPRKVNSWVLQNGTFRCASCNPTIEVKADGKDRPGIRTAVRNDWGQARGPRTVQEIETKNGSVVSDETFTVSQNGKTIPG
jgi:hypothetical protein